MPATASTGSGRPVTRIAELDLTAIALLARPRQHVRDERGQVRAVGAHAPQRRLVLDARRVEQPLGRRVHQHDVAFLVGHQDRVGHRVDDQVEPVTLVAHFRLRDAQRAVALLDLLLGARQVGDVAQDRHHVGALAFVLRARAEELEQQVGSFERDRPAAARAAPARSCRPRSSTAPPRTACCSAPRRAASPSLASSGAANSFSAWLLAMISLPSVSVRRIGSVTALMML